MKIFIQFGIITAILVFSITLIGCGNSPQKNNFSESKTKKLTLSEKNYVKTKTSTANTISDKHKIMSQAVTSITPNKNTTPKQYKGADELLKEKFEREHSKK
jgi:hypothetical protein